MASPLLLGAIALCLARAVGQTLPPAPGAQFAASTYTIAALDALSPGNPPPMLPAFVFTYANNQTWTDPSTQIQYAVPDQVSYIIEPTSACVTESVVNFSSVSFAEAYAQSQSMGISAFLGFFQASISTSMAELMSMQAEGAYAFGASMCNFSTGYIDMYPLALERVSPMLIDYVNTTLAGMTSYSGVGIQAWAEFFTYWGTGYFKQLTLGGAGGVVFGTAAATFEQMGQLWVSAQANLNVGWFVAQAGGSVAGGASEASAQFIDNTVFLYKWAGGTCSPGGSGCAFKDWENSLFATPVPLSFSGGPLSDVVALINPSLEAAASDAIANLSAIDMLDSLVAPIFEDVLGMIARMSYTSSDPCTTVTSACYDVVYNDPICCATAWTGAAYPTPAVFASYNASATALAAQLQKAQMIIVTASAAKWISGAELLGVLALVPQAAAIKGAGMAVATCQMNYVPSTPADCPYGGSRSWSPGANGYWCNYDRGNSAFQHLAAAGCNGPQSCQSNCQLCDNIPQTCLNEGYRCTLPNWCRNNAGPVSPSISSTWPAGLAA